MTLVSQKGWGMLGGLLWGLVITISALIYSRQIFLSSLCEYFHHYLWFLFLLNFVDMVAIKNFFSLARYVVT